jgi:Ankyrin repeats (many copies)
MAHHNRLENAIRAWDVDMVGKLIDRGADVNAVWNPLDCAIRVSSAFGYGYGISRPCPLHVIELLLERGADVNMPEGYWRYTPLMQASVSGDVEIVNLLIANGADVFQRDHGGETALQLVYPMSLNPRISHILCEKRCQVVEILEAEMDRAWAVDNNPRNLALAMGNHDRIGESSPLLDLDPGVVEMISRFSAPDHRREGYHPRVVF